ncbi:MAG: methionine adenosyltransferase [bacterium (Candidatus Ratteibacteria) CG23_combo_of_CG06-09_8_20_14_all_48_7]|uniref:S-adenosylmethionine synthase n=1 Tax=bacterium (Candidatus Ratteibacteria) CG23_combo_of_CG06-09_8_20_14_all_48_7 TaxID=2014292 RepID=A0A2G9YAX0_9BACT|nr:MAG: methionine adenosyltransferase [bacterium (Candidatus Ratteibacteria) CG23_combo_of_CG06-09_8_20_14_all_48_7]
MEKGSYLFTSESVTEGHPDKICDQISDSILDEILRQDPNGRVACETMVTRGLVFIAGEITTKARIDIPRIARGLIREVGYTDPAYGFNCMESSVITAVQEQSPDIAAGVDTGGAGDQGLMFGYACTETPALMPLPIMLAHQLVQRLAAVRGEGVLPYLRPDGKSQVTVRYEEGIPKEVTCVVLAAQHDPGMEQKKIRDDLTREVIFKVISKEMLSPELKVFVNPTGSFVVGGPQGDTGVTGRKIIVDTYGGFGRHGGGCFSGKDPTKVDRSGSYLARYLAKNIVAAGICQRCEIQIAYVIGERQPVSLYLNTYGTGRIPEEKIQNLIQKRLDLSPRGIIKMLDLLKPRYRNAACYGHFGRTEPEFTWERIDLAETFRTLL